jgi:hypothetical protein
MIESVAHYEKGKCMRNVLTVDAVVGDRLAFSLSVEEVNVLIELADLVQRHGDFALRLDSRQLMRRVAHEIRDQKFEVAA